MFIKKPAPRLLALFSLMILSVGVEAAPNQAKQSAQQHSSVRQADSNQEAKYEIMQRNEIDDTDTLAIPLDDSEVEDEEEINAAEKKNVFSLPQAR